MTFSEKTILTLEFDKIRNILASFVKTKGGKERALSLTPTQNMGEAQRRQQETTDALRLANAKGQPSFGDVTNPQNALDRACKGAMLTTRELLDVANLLKTVKSLITYAKENRTFQTVLDEWFNLLMPNNYLEKLISDSIISEELIADEASHELAEIRRKIRSEQNRIKETLQHYISGAYSSYLQENLVTTRDGRYVVPVKTECKNEIKGLVHDTSASGSTVFIEPMAVVEANNELRILKSREDHEIERILFHLSGEVANAADPLARNYLLVENLSFAFGCADYSLKIKGSEPIFTEKRMVNLKKARHPLIDKEKVVPISLTLGEDYDTLIITGPNTGGKTVTMKTLGLLCTMAQSGLHIPCDEGSTLCLFDDILVDIGDEQSIEQSLSTFSSHMVNIVRITSQVTNKSLCLFDELGAGTDPIEGASLAIAVIETVQKAGALCLATTHYNELKTFAVNSYRVENASCEFDVATLMPTYRLLIGTPGRSNAFAISEKLGLSKEIIALAKSHVDNSQQELEEVIAKLQDARIIAEKAQEEAEFYRAETKKLYDEAEKNITQKTEKAIKEAEANKKKSQEILNSAKASSDYVFEQLEKAKKAQDTERFAKELEEARNAVRASIRNEKNKMPLEIDTKKAEQAEAPKSVKVGDKVYLLRIQKEGYVETLPDKDGKVLVQAGIIKTKVPLSELRLCEELPQVIVEGKKMTPAQYIIQSSRTCKPEIDLRGLNGDEAWLQVDKYIDEATMAGLHSVTLLHGKGTGMLRKALWERLKKDKRLKSFRLGQFGEGDSGVTIIELK